MTIDEYVASEKALLEQFQAFWREQQKENPIDFPVTMGQGDWSEQFEAYVISQ